MEIIGPLAMLLIFMILFALYGNFKFPVTIALGRGDDGTGRRADRAEADAHAVQRVVRARTCWR